MCAVLLLLLRRVCLKSGCFYIHMWKKSERAAGRAGVHMLLGGGGGARRQHAMDVVLMGVCCFDA